MRTMSIPTLACKPIGRGTVTDRSFDGSDPATPAPDSEQPKARGSTLLHTQITALNLRSAGRNLGLVIRKPSFAEPGGALH